MSRLFLVTLMLVVFSASIAAQERNSASSSGRVLKIVPMTRVEPTSGEQMFQTYCASCHGSNAKGNGPASEFLPAAAPDLTKLASRNHGKYPAVRVAATLKFGTGTTPHAEGTAEMPHWGPLFRRLDNDRILADLRVHNLSEYIESLQQ